MSDGDCTAFRTFRGEKPKECIHKRRIAQLEVKNNNLKASYETRQTQNINLRIANQKLKEDYDSCARDLTLNEDIAQGLREALDKAQRDLSKALLLDVLDWTEVHKIERDIFKQIKGE